MSFTSRTVDGFTGAVGNMLLVNIGQGRITNNPGTSITDVDGSLLIPDEESIEMVYCLLDTEGPYIGTGRRSCVQARSKARF